MEKELENIFKVANQNLTTEVLAELKDAEVKADDPSLEGLVKAAKEVRLAGKLPYYTSKAIGCWFASDDGSVKKMIENAGIEAAVRMMTGLEKERELIFDISEAYTAIVEGTQFVRPEEQVALIKKAFEKGYYSEKTFRGCAQCTIDGLMSTLGNVEPTLFRASDMMATGCGLFGDGPCGGYSGGLLYMGMNAGRRLDHFESDRPEQLKGRHLADLLHKKFLKCYGTIVCHEVHKDIFGRSFDVRDSEDKVLFEEAGAHKMDKCTYVVGNAARWVTEILLDEGEITA